MKTIAALEKRIKTIKMQISGHEMHLWLAQQKLKKAEQELIDRKKKKTT